MSQFLKSLHKLTVVEGVPVVIFSNTELDEETLQPTGKIELFWYAFFNGTFYGDVVTFEGAELIAENVGIIFTSAVEKVKTIKAQEYGATPKA